MSEAVESISPDASVGEARARLRREEVRHLVVVEGDAVVGVLSQEDLRRAGRALSVRAAMSAPVVTATPETSIREAANQMRGNHVSCLPVLSGGRVVGMVTASNLLDLIGKGVTRKPEVDKRRHRSWVPGR